MAVRPSTLIRSPFVLGIVALMSAAFGQFQPETDLLIFDGGHRFAVTQVCIDNGYLRPFQPVRQVCQAKDHSGRPLSLFKCPASKREAKILKLPITQILRYDLGDERQVTLVNRLQTRNINLNDRPGLHRNTIGERSFNIPNCPNSLIELSSHPIKSLVPSEQERIILTALFQHGITLVRQVTIGNESEFGINITSANDHSFSLSLQAPQCLNGQIELSEEFTQYLKTPFAQDFLFRLYTGEGSNLLDLYNPILNLRLIGGEGSGSGRIVGGEGSGSGRALEGRHFDPLTPQAGTVTLKIHTHWLNFINGNFDTASEDLSTIINDLLHGEQVPEDLVQVQCH